MYVELLVIYWQSAQINEKTKIIECCGDLFLSALDPHNRDGDYYFDRVNDDVMYDISHFLSRYVFELEEVDENLAKNELDHMRAADIYQKSALLRIDRTAPQYYWENIPIYQ